MAEVYIDTRKREFVVNSAASLLPVLLVGSFGYLKLSRLTTELSESLDFYAGSFHFSLWPVACGPVGRHFCGLRAVGRPRRVAAAQAAAEPHPQAPDQHAQRRRRRRGRRA